MSNVLTSVRPGLALIILTLLFGVVLGISFGINEDGYQKWIAEGIAAHPTLHDEHSKAEIWRFVERAHFHATGIAAFSLGLILVVALSGMRAGMKKISSALIGLAGFYPLSWLSIFMLAPSMGPDGAEGALLPKMFVLIGVGGLLCGLAILALHLLFDMWKE